MQSKRGHREPKFVPPLLWHLDPRVKVACAGVLVGVVLALPLSANRWLWAYAALVLGLAALGQLPLRWLLGRASILLPFIVLGAALLPLARPTVPADAMVMGGLRLSRLAVATYESVAGKCLLSLLAVNVLVGTTAPADLLRALQGLGAPRTVTALLSFAIAYLEVLGAEARRMILARDSRGGRPGILRGIAVTTALLRALLVRSFERAERVALAMVARGFEGRMPNLHPRPVPGTQVAAGAGFALLTILPHLFSIWS